MQDVQQVMAQADTNDKAERALEVVRELYRRYRAQDERYHNYLKLIGFIGFAALLLTVLYLQRDANILHQVHSTIASEVLPNPDEVSSPQDVLSWLQKFLKVSAQLSIICSRHKHHTFRIVPFGMYSNAYHASRVMQAL
jgi:hypothetical protein